MTRPYDLKVGDKFRVIGNSTFHVFDIGEILFLREDNGTDSPYFFNHKLDFQSIFFSDLEPVTKTLRDIQPGDIIVDEDDKEAKVIDVLPNSFLRSFWGDFSFTSCWHSFEEAEKTDWKIKGCEEDEEEMIEMTLDEVAELRGVDVSRIRIKE